MVEFNSGKSKMHYLSKPFYQSLKKDCLNPEVTQFLEALNHPLAAEITALRKLVLSANKGLSENIKWNGPNYTFNGEDRITMRIHPPRQLQLIFHRGAKVQAVPNHKLINNDTGLLVWKTTDRAVATFKNREAIENNKNALAKLVNEWLKAAT